MRRAPGMHVLSPEQARQLLQKGHGDRLKAFYVLAVTTGARLGELLGIHWRDVDLDGASLNIVTSLQRTRNGLEFVEPKQSPLAPARFSHHRSCESAARSSEAPERSPPGGERVERPRSRIRQRERPPYRGWQSSAPLIRAAAQEGRPAGYPAA
jgi:hypothetical protein